jgi:hypothetical protein
MAAFTARVAQNRSETISQVLRDETHTQPAIQAMGLANDDSQSLIQTFQSVVDLDCTTCARQCYAI